MTTPQIIILSTLALLAFVSFSGIQIAKTDAWKSGWAYNNNSIVAYYLPKIN